MALFQPTNVTPSAFGELGNGVVNALDGLTVSWQVNGNSAMTAFSIAVYKNDAASTLVYSTGKLTNGCPFYGVDGAGNIKLFKYSIPYSTLSGLSAWGNGNEYKLIITQYWSSTEYVTQTSASAFVTREAPILLMDDFTNPVANISATFTATYYQAQGDAINWVRWILADNDYETIKDTGNIYGTAELSFTYDGLFSGESYYIRCLAQTENGVNADTGYTAFDVSYDTETVSGEVTVCAVPSLSGVKVTWPAPKSVSGVGSGTYSLVGGNIAMNSGASVYWDTDTGEAMNLTNPWTIAWRGCADGLTTNTQLFNVNDGALVLKPRSLQSGESGLAWAQLSTPMSGADTTAVAYGNGTFVVLTNGGNSLGGYVFRSTDEGETWGWAVTPEIREWSSVAYGSNTFVAVSREAIAYSTDYGVSWTEVAIPSDVWGIMASVAYGDGKFVCSSINSNEIIYSTDNGKTWSYTTVPITSAAGYRVVYGNSRFVAVNIYATSNAYSTDGINWTTATNPTSGGVSGAAYSGSCFLIADADTSSGAKFYRSTNGTSWTAISTISSSTVPDGATLSVAYGGGAFLAWDTSRLSAPELLLYSTDNGATWSSWSFGFSNTYISMAYGQNNFIAAGGGLGISLPTQGFALTMSGTTILQPLLAKATETVVVLTQNASGDLSLDVGYIYGGNAIKTGVMSWSKTGATVLNISKLSMTGPQLCDYLLVLYGGGYASKYTSTPSYHPEFSAQTQFFADFVKDLDAGPLGSDKSASGVRVYRQKAGETALTLVANMPSSSREMIDCSARSQEEVRYFVYSIFSDSGATSALTTDYVTPCFWDWALLACKTDENGRHTPYGVYLFGKNLSTGSISNNGGANLLKNFTRYPTVQTLPYNYASGSLTSLIGSIAAGVYSDTRTLRDAITGVVEGADSLFLKSRKGDLWRIAISGNISMNTMDNTRQQAQTVSLPWTEIASADGERIVIPQDGELWPED